MAIQVLEMFKRQGLDIPRDLAIASVDALLAMQTSTPPITKTNPPFTEMERQAVRLLLARLTGQPVPDIVNVPAQLIMRQSCGCHSAAMIQAASGLRFSSSSTRAGSLEQAQINVFQEALCNAMCVRSFRRSS